MFDIEEKVSVIKWLISAQGLDGIPTISEGYNLTPQELEELYGAELDVFGHPIPISVESVYYPNGRRIQCSEILQTTYVDVLASDILGDGAVLLPPAPDGKYWVVEAVEFNRQQVDYDVATLQYPYDLPKDCIQLEPFYPNDQPEHHLKFKINYTTR